MVGHALSQAIAALVIEKTIRPNSKEGQFSLCLD